MTTSPIIAFGQQPCGFFPKRYLYAKIKTARRLQREMGGEIAFFYHDSDHDPRETTTILRQRKSETPVRLNFSFANEIQKKYSPLYLKRVSKDWQTKMAQDLRGFIGHPRWLEAFNSVTSDNVADFCLDCYGRMGLLEGIRVVRSSDPAVRTAACDVADYFVDVPYSNEIVRARFVDGALKLHKGGGVFLDLPPTTFTKEHISPTRDTRLLWMQSVVHCTHYIAGAGEQAYLNKDQTPEITFVVRESIERQDEAYTELPT